MNEPADNTWHQQPWIWFVIGLLVVTMLASFAMLYVAMNNAPDLVVEDYANIEQLTEQTREQDQRAAELGLSAELSIDVAAGNSAVLVLRSSSTAMAHDNYGQNGQQHAGQSRYECRTKWHGRALHRHTAITRQRL